MLPDRKVFCQDTSDYLKTGVSFDSVITSLPDKEETTMEFPEWEEWFVSMVSQIIEKTENYAIFYQTDRKTEGRLIDKSYLLNKGNEVAGGKIIFHKVVLTREAGTIDLFRPTYTHLLCFSKKKRSGKATPDVIKRGKMVYKNAMGLDACEFAVKFIIDNSDTKKIYDPFCGQGSILAMANKYGLDGEGVDILPDQCTLAQQLLL